MIKYKFCKNRVKPRQYLRGGADAFASGAVVVAPHSSGRNLDDVIDWIHAYGDRCGHAPVTQSRNKREGCYVGKHVWFIVGDRGFGTGKIHMWKDGKHRHHRGNYMTTVNRRVMQQRVTDLGPGIGRGLHRSYLL